MTAVSSATSNVQTITSATLLTKVGSAIARTSLKFISGVKINEKYQTTNLGGDGQEITDEVMSGLSIDITAAFVSDAAEDVFTQPAFSSGTPTLPTDTTWRRNIGSLMDGTTQVGFEYTWNEKLRSGTGVGTVRHMRRTIPSATIKARVPLGDIKNLATTPTAVTINAVKTTTDLLGVTLSVPSGAPTDGMYVYDELLNT